MSVVMVEVDELYKEKFLKTIDTFPKDKVRLVKDKAFGILKGKGIDPVAWQKAIREENSRDVYRGYKSF